jgi:hypothetical protein
LREHADAPADTAADQRLLCRVGGRGPSIRRRDGSHPVVDNQRIEERGRESLQDAERRRTTSDDVGRRRTTPPLVRSLGLTLGGRNTERAIGAPRRTQSPESVSASLEQRGLAYSRPSMHHQDSSASADRGVDQPVEHLPLTPLADQVLSGRLGEHLR